MDIAAAQEHVRAAPASSEAHRAMGHAWLGRCRTAEAQQEYLRAWMLGDDAAVKGCGIAAACLIDDSPDLALQHLEGSGALDTLAGAELRAAALSQRGDTDAAAECLPSSPPGSGDTVGWFARAVYQLGMGNLHEVGVACDQALACDADFAPARFMRAFARRRADRFADALRDYQPLAQELPNNAAAQYFAADCLAAVDRLPEAYELVRAAARRRVSHPGFQLIAARMLMSRGRYERAEALLRLDSFPQAMVLVAAQYRVQCLVGLGRPHEAAQLATEQYPELENWAFVVRQLAVAEGNRGNSEPAEHYWRRYTQLAPDDPDGWCQLAYVRLGCEDVEEAESIMRQLQRRSPGYGGADFVWGALAHRNQNYRLAVTCFDRFRRWMPGSGEGHYLFGLSLTNLMNGQVTQTTYDAWREAVRRAPRLTEAWWYLAQAGAVRVRQLMERLTGSRSPLTVQAKALPPMRVVDAAVRAGCPYDAFGSLVDYVDQTHRLWGINCEWFRERLGFARHRERLERMVRVGRAYGVPEQFLTG